MHDQRILRFLVLVTICLIGLPGLSEAGAKSEVSQLTERQLGCTQCSPPDDQRLAEELFLGAKALLEQGNYLEAVRLYERALTHWDNPIIRYGLARALYLQNRLFEAYLHVVEVLAYGSDCFDPRMWNNVEKLASFLKKALGSIGEVEIVCRDPAARIELDDGLAFMCREPAAIAERKGKKKIATCKEPEAPIQIHKGWTFTLRGEVKRFLPAGIHKITASKHGHETQVKTLVLAADKKLRFEIDLVGEEDRLEHRSGLKTWAPVGLAGAGAAMLAIAGILHNDSNRATPAAKSYYFAGGATLTLGLIIMGFNQLQSDRPEKRDESRVTIRPLSLQQAHGISLDLDF